jgi:hypothetical protein
MHVIVMVVCGRAGIIAQGVLQAPLIIQNLMDKSFIKKSFECAIYGHPVKGRRNLALYIAM